MPGYFSKVAFISPTANGRGSMSSAAPNCLAATVPAPYFISPWVSVGPSSTTSTFLPLMAAESSTVKGEAAITTCAAGFTAATLASTVSMPARSAVSTLLTTITSAMRRFTSPG